MFKYSFWGMLIQFLLLWKKNRTADLFSGIWPLQRNLERILWVKMTSNLISKSRNGISIPKNPKNDYSKHIGDVFWRNIRDFFLQKMAPKMAKLRNSKNQNYRCNTTRTMVKQYELWSLSFNNILDRSIFSKRKLHYEDAISNGENL